jgi:hypothetical protein
MNGHCLLADNMREPDGIGEFSGARRPGPASYPAHPLHSRISIS